MKEPPFTIRNLLERTTGFFREKGIDSARLDAEVLLAHVLSLARLDLYLDHDRPLMDDEVDRYREVVRRRARREPVAYITGVREFYGRAFAVGPGVLVPRPETEHVVDAILPAIRELASPRVIDLGTGSGAILLTLLAEIPGATGIGVDREGAALAWAARNAERLALGSRVRWVRGSWFDAIAADARVAAIVSNPPYVALDQWGGLAADITRHEPRSALVAGAAGTECLAVLARESARHLQPGGVVAVEVGASQGGRVAGWFRSSPEFESVEILADHAGVERVVLARAARAGRGGGCRADEVALLRT